jgi:hypothetical protein
VARPGAIAPRGFIFLIIDKAPRLFADIMVEHVEAWLAERVCFSSVGSRQAGSWPF